MFTCVEKKKKKLSGFISGPKQKQRGWESRRCVEVMYEPGATEMKLFFFFFTESKSLKSWLVLTERLSALNLVLLKKKSK